MRIQTGPTLQALQQAGFPMGGEPSISVDLADTLVTVTEPATDLLFDPDQQRLWWQLQSSRLPPDAPIPDVTATRRLRHAVRDSFDALLENRVPPTASLDDLNAAAAAAPASTRLDVVAEGLRRSLRWHVEYGGNPALAAIATDAMTVLTDTHHRDQLRRCANPDCSMLFLATNPRRNWCTANICGNRARVARHYHRRIDTSG
ncbi:CGNR zinc finger domain-containing protein [Mycobacterium kyorinense]|uniref:CGNR zinc finger domain-containing protein n=1 Tax=Mycobacterium kyorinense TaxID=487514 RepID=UPI00070553DA|nr:CGNR zinc finger domain-containing protein [Mycobacterium kyorinense]